jgi:hypothetical protein
VARPPRYALIGLGVLAFLVVSAGIARVLGAAAAERDAAIETIRAQSRARHRGEVRVLRVDGPPRLGLSSQTGTARIVWRAGEALPVVQCVRLRRQGDVLRGFRVRVLALSRPIPREAGCPGS